MIPGSSRYRARYYDPAAGRFLNEDPMRFDAGVNFYAYTLNSRKCLSTSSTLL
jgi:RHS repeat-associated protein